MVMDKTWWKYAGIRAVKTCAQTAVAMIGTAVVLKDVDWIAVLSAAILAGVLSLLTSVAGIPEVDQQLYMDQVRDADFYEDDEEPEDDYEESVEELY